jgi:small-conductance mechanosensitive channel
MSFNDFLQLEILFSISVLDIIQLILLLIILRIVLIASLRVTARYSKKISLIEENQVVFRRLVRIIINLLGTLLVFKFAGIPLSTILSYEILKVGQYPFRTSNIINAIISLLVAQTVLWLIYKVLDGVYKKRNDLDIGTQFAINQILKYIIYTIAILSSIQALGFNLTVVWGGAAALLVGFGLGLQQTFTDLISGIFMLVERGVNVGDILQVGEQVGKVKKIGFRASEIVTRDNIVLLIPNSKLVGDTIINWSHNDTNVRFMIDVNVAYDSDVDFVRKILLEVVHAKEDISKTPKPNIRFVSFGESALNFKVVFWASGDFFYIIEDLKSDLHYAINRAFKEHNISIPFPQREVWIRK